VTHFQKELISMTREVRALRIKRSTYIETAQAVIEKAINESRGLTDAENKDVEGLRKKAETVLRQIELTEDGQDAGRTTNRSGSFNVGEFLGGGGASNGPFESIGEQLISVARAATHGQEVDPRLFQVVNRAGATGMGGVVPSDGGFLVQEDFSTQLLNRAFAVSQVASRCQDVPISTNANGMKLPRLDEKSRADGSRFGGVLGYWLSEGAPFTGTKPKFGLNELTLKKLGVLVYATDELLQDSAAMASYVDRVAAAELAFQLDVAVINGPGAGRPLGVLQSPALITVDKENAQAADTVVFENIVKMYSRLPASSVSTAVWYCSQSVFTQLPGLNVSVGLGGSLVYMPPGGISGNPYSTLLGRPVIQIEQASKLGDKGDIMLCDMSRYLLAKKGGIQSASSIHVEFLTDQQVFRFLMRVDGQPDTPYAVTPYNGGPTESPFITLAAR
jgi:HK97 family phage major capsid protein